MCIYIYIYIYIYVCMYIYIYMFQPNQSSTSDLRLVWRPKLTAHGHGMSTTRTHLKIVLRSAAREPAPPRIRPPHKPLKNSNHYIYARPNHISARPVGSAPTCNPRLSRTAPRFAPLKLKPTDCPLPSQRPCASCRSLCCEG